jgi:hypothetical protein
MARTIIAFLAAPLVPALLTGWFGFMNGTYHPLAIFVLVCGCLYVLQAIVGVPAYLLLGRVRQHRIWTYALLGFAGAALPFLVYGSMRDLDRVGAGQAAYVIVFVGLLGAISAVIFWLLARPDKIASSTAANPSHPTAA